MKSQTRRSEPAKPGVIHPVIIYPFVQPGHYNDLKALYELVARLNSDPSRYARPITVMDRKTHYGMEGNPAFARFRKDTVEAVSDVIDTWGVDTCQMWYVGLGAAFERGRAGDVYWLIPGDFNYGSATGREVLGGLHDLPEIIMELDQDLCIGEIAAEQCNSKQLIDTYGTFALLYNWFPAEAQEIRQFTERPRSEFFAIRHQFLKEMLLQRWYAYEQTVVILLHAVSRKKRISRFFVGHITDLPEGRESLSSALEQVGRTERVLKSLWREQNQRREKEKGELYKADAPHRKAHTGWIDRYRQLENQSEQIRRTALTVLQNLLS